MLKTFAVALLAIAVSVSLAQAQGTGQGTHMHIRSHTHMHTHMNMHPHMHAHPSHAYPSERVCAPAHAYASARVHAHAPTHAEAHDSRLSHGPARSCNMRLRYGCQSPSVAVSQGTVVPPLPGLHDVGRRRLRKRSRSNAGRDCLTRLAPRRASFDHAGYQLSTPAFLKPSAMRSMSSGRLKG